MAKKEQEIGVAVRILGVILSMLCLLQQLGATCSNAGHSSIVIDALLATHFSDAATPKRVQHSSGCCHHRHDKPAIPEDDSAPYHLCSASHQVFTVPSDVELPDHSTESFWGVMFDFLVDANISLDHLISQLHQLSDLTPYGLSLRAQSQLLQI